MIYANKTGVKIMQDDDLNVSTSAHVVCNGTVRTKKVSFATELLIKRKGYLVGYYASMIF